MTVWGVGACFGVSSWVPKSPPITSKPLPASASVSLPLCRDHLAPVFWNWVYFGEFGGWGYWDGLVDQWGRPGCGQAGGHLGWGLARLGGCRTGVIQSSVQLTYMDLCPSGPVSIQSGIHGSGVHPDQGPASPASVHPRPPGRGHSSLQSGQDPQSIPRWPQTPSHQAHQATDPEPWGDTGGGETSTQSI